MARRTIRDLTNVERDEIARSYVAGDTMAHLAGRFRVGVSSVRRLLASRGVAIRGRDEAQPPPYMPTPAEIEAMKVEIREGWVGDDGRNRNGQPEEPYQPRIIHMLGQDHRLLGSNARRVI